MKKHILLCIALVHSTINCMQSITEEPKYSPEKYPAFIAEKINQRMLVINQKWNGLVGAILNQEISKFIANGADINMQINDKGKNTLLHFIAAGHYDYLPTEQIMRSSQLKVNIQNAFGDTPLHCTVLEIIPEKNQTLIEGRFAIAKKLIDHTDINPNIQNKKGQTPLLLAIEHKREDLIKLFLSNKETNLSIASNDEKAPLHYTSMYKFVTLFKTISKPNIQDQYGNSPLHYAQTAEAITFLLSLPGINATIKNNLGKTPLDYAYEQNYPEKEAVIALLQKAVTPAEPSPEKPQEIIGSRTDNNPSAAQSFFENHKKAIAIGSFIGIIALIFAYFHRNINLIRS